MAATHRVMIGVLTFCVLGTPLSETLFAQTPSGSADRQGVNTVAPGPAAADHLRLNLDKELFTSDARIGAEEAQSAFAQRGRYYGRERHHHGNAAAIGLGAVAAIAGGAMLVYANRPACSTNPGATGCGYGMKVAGGAVLSAGFVGLVVGSVSWR